MTSEQANEWVSLRSQGRGRLSEGDAADFLRTGATAIELSLVASLSGAEQATAMRDIAARTSRMLRDREVEDEPKCAFVHAVPKLLADATAREATDARITFWELLLGPVFEPGFPVSPALAAALVETLREQLASNDEILQWSARQGLSVLPRHLAERVLDHRDAESKRRTSLIARMSCEEEEAGEC